MCSHTGLAAALLLAGCSEHALHPRPEGEGRKDRPDIAVTPDRIDFGALGRGESATRAFTVSNAGDDGSVLEIEALAIEGAGEFTLVEAFAEFRLPAGDARTFHVTFTPPDSLPDEAEAVVISDDDDEGVLRVPLGGSGIYPALSITPDPLELGEVQAGCAVDDLLVLSNTGSDLLTVTALTQAGPGFTLLSPPELPLRLLPGEVVPLQIRFSPSVGGDHDGVVRGTSDDPAGERAAVQHGTGLEIVHTTDVFDLPSAAPIDIQFFVDQSWSMRDDMAELVDNFDAFVAALDDISTNWHLIVTNHDDGCSISGVLTHDTPDYAAEFADDATQGGGELTEAGLFVATNGAEEGGPDGCNAGFLRDDALLHVVLVSDEPDQSPDGWRSYVDRLTAVKGGDASLLTISAVAGDWPAGCETSTNSAAAGSGYHEAALATGGAFLSICSDWAQHVLDLAAETELPAPRFPLSGVPDPATLTVRVDGVLRAEGWAWEAPTNEIVFAEGTVPGPGAHVEVGWSAPSACP